MIIDVKSMAQEVKNKVAQEVKEYMAENDGCPPSLMIIQVGDDETSSRYVSGKVKDCEEVGIDCGLRRFPAGVHRGTITSWFNRFGHMYNGIIIQQPAEIEGLNDSVERGLIELYMMPWQDVDGFDRKSRHLPATPKGIMRILEKIGVELAGKRVCVIGRGKLVGAPLVPLLMRAGATVVSCNSKTRDLKDEISRSDIVVCATGHKIIGEEMRPLLKGKIIIDAGIRFKNGKICGDVDKNLYDMEDTWFTSVPGGVGLMTRAMLLENTMNAAR